MTHHDRLAHLESENARLEAEILKKIHENSELFRQKTVLTGERDRARDLAQNLEENLAISDGLLSMLCWIISHEYEAPAT